MSDALRSRIDDLEAQLQLHEQIRAEIEGQVIALEDQVRLLDQIKHQLEAEIEIISASRQIGNQTIDALQATLDTQASIVETQKTLITSQSEIIDQQRARISRLEEALVPFMARQKQDVPS